MERLRFEIVKGIKTPDPVSDKYMLLSYFISDHQYPDDIQKSIDELKTVQSGYRTFEEVFTDKYGTIPIGVTAGEFECDKNTAYLISNNPGREPNIEMPLQELIDLLAQWEAFLRN